MGTSRTKLSMEKTPVLIRQSSAVFPERDPARTQTIFTRSASGDLVFAGGDDYYDHHQA